MLLLCLARRGEGEGDRGGEQGEESGGGMGGRLVRGGGGDGGRGRAEAYGLAQQVVKDVDVPEPTVGLQLLIVARSARGALQRAMPGGT